MEKKSKPVCEQPSWKQKLCRHREAERKAAHKENKRQDHRRFTIGDLVGAAFPELLQSDISKGNAAYKAINAALVYLKEHPEIYQSYSTSSNMCTYTKEHMEGHHDGNV